MAREMFGACHYTHILHTLHILYGKQGNLVFIFSETPVIDHRIIRIIVYVNHGCIIYLDAKALTLFSNDLPVFI